MKVGILAGGKGTRISEETVVKPKPMVEIGGRPIIWHIMRHYAHFGHQEFVVALGYKGEVLKKYFVDYASLSGNLKIDWGKGTVQNEGESALNWEIDLIDTGLNTMTGGRIKRIIPYMGNETFMLTWGDGVANVDLDELLKFHQSHGKLATLTAVRPPARYGHLVFDGSRVAQFDEKPQIGEGWINGAFFVLEPGVYDYIAGDDTMWEQEPLERLAKDGQLMAYKHDSFWQCMDTLREKHILETLWEAGEAPWKMWDR